MRGLVGSGAYAATCSGLRAGSRSVCRVGCQGGGRTCERPQGQEDAIMRECRSERGANGMKAAASQGLEARSGPRRFVG